MVEVAALADADRDASSSSRRLVISSTAQKDKLVRHCKCTRCIGTDVDLDKRTFPEHLRRDSFKFALELVEQIVHSRGELALGIGVLRVSRLARAAS